MTNDRAPAGPGVPDYLLVSQVFPPAIGGSGVLLDNIYSRVSGGQVTALVDVPPLQQRADSGTIRVVRTRMDPHAWGLFDPRGWAGLAQLTAAIYRRAAHRRAVVHCGRAQPEAIPALLARIIPGGPPYIFWAHGEDITAAMSSRQYAVTMRLVYRRASAAIANSENTARMIASVGWLRGSLHVVYPGVDAARFHPGADSGSLRARLAPRQELVLLSLSRLQKRKGHDLVLRALPELLREVGAIRYVIVGAGDQREPLERQAEALGLSQVVQFEGEVDAEMLPAYYAACDVFVLPTRVEPFDFEGFGIVYLEAAAAGKPAIGGRNGGVPEAVADEQTGLLVTGDDVSELVRALKELCQSEDLRLKMGRAGRERVLQKFTWERAAAAVTEIQRSVAARR